MGMRPAPMAADYLLAVERNETWDQGQKPHDLVDEAHAGGYEVRFWATPDIGASAREAVWRELVAADVDQINTDHLRELEEFLKGYDPTEQAR